MISDPLHQQKALSETLVIGGKPPRSTSFLDGSEAAEYKVEKESGARDQDSSVVAQNPTGQVSEITQEEISKGSPDAASQLQRETPQTSSVEEHESLESEGVGQSPPLAHEPIRQVLA